MLAAKARAAGGQSGGNAPVEFVDFIALANQGSDASRTLTISSGLSAGDVVIAMTANRTNTPPALASGYTDILSGNNDGLNRSLRLQYKVVSGSSESITWTGSYGFMVALRNFRSIGQSEVTNSIGINSTANIPIPAISGLDTTGVGYLLAGTYFSNLMTAVSGPYTLGSSTYAYIEENTSASYSQENFTNPTTTYVSWVVEIL